MALNHSHSSGWANSGHKLYLVVDDVLETDALGLVEVVEELLVEDEGDAGDLLDVTLRLRVPVYEVDSDRDGQLAPELFPSETLKEVGIFSVSTCIYILIRSQGDH